MWPPAPALYHPLADQESDKVPGRVGLGVLRAGGVADGHILKAGHAQLAEEPLAVLRTRRTDLIGGHHILRLA